MLLRGRQGSQLQDLPLAGDFCDAGMGLLAEEQSGAAKPGSVVSFVLRAAGRSRALTDLFPGPSWGSAEAPVGATAPGAELQLELPDRSDFRTCHGTETGHRRPRNPADAGGAEMLQ